MFVRTKGLLLVTTALLYSSLAHTAPKMDANGDDEISHLEYMSFRSNSFNKQDKNFDGRLSREEINEATLERIRENLKSRFKKMDINGDGRVTEFEHEEIADIKSDKSTERGLDRWDKWFSRVDKDKNGHISRLEFDADNETQITRSYEKRRGSTQETFSKMDLDGDGNVTEHEYIDKNKILSQGTSGKPDPVTGIQGNETSQHKRPLLRDGNRDGNITKREDREFYEYHFDKHDRNDDDKLTKKEAAHLFRENADFVHMP